MVMLKYKWIKSKSQRARIPGAQVKNIIIHSTDGRKAGDIQVLTKGKVSVHWYITRAGELYHFVDDARCAYHVGRVLYPENSNDSTVGIEMEHFDGKEGWTEVQMTILAKLIVYLRQKFGNLPVKSHAEVAYPSGRKQDPLDFEWERLSKMYKMYKDSKISMVKA